MHFYIMTLFPDMVMNGLNTSITGRAIEKGLLSIDAVNIRDYAYNKHNSVDDYPYGGGAGMLMQAEPVYQTYEAICQKSGKRPRVVYLSPQAGRSARRWPRSMPGKKNWCYCADITKASTRGYWKRS